MSENGASPLASDTEIIAALRRRIDNLRRETARYEKALALIDGSAPKLGRPPRNGAPQPKAPRERRVGPERLADVERTIREIAAEHDEFTQVDVRERTGFSSSMMAAAFEQLRQQGVIRLARKDGIRKMFRLTQEALVSSSAEEPIS